MFSCLSRTRRVATLKVTDCVTVSSWTLVLFESILSSACHLNICDTPRILLHSTDLMWTSVKMDSSLQVNVEKNYPIPVPRFKATEQQAILSPTGNTGRAKSFSSWFLKKICWATRKDLHLVLSQVSLTKFFFFNYLHHKTFRHVSNFCRSTKH